MYYGCEQCRELWRKYALTTSVHLRLDHQLRAAALQSDLEAIVSLTIETEGAEKIRNELRQSIREHEQSRHRIPRAATPE
jgi:hypothetical protein